MTLLNKWKIRRLERRIDKWKREGQRLLVELVKGNQDAIILSKYCKEALDEFFKGEPSK